MNNQEINVGTDIGKHQLDIYIRPLGEYFTVANDAKGVKGVKKAIKRIVIYHINEHSIFRLILSLNLTFPKMSLLKFYSLPILATWI